MKYNLLYQTKTGEKIYARRVGGYDRDLEMESGMIIKRSWALKHLKYLGAYDKSGNFMPYKKPRMKKVTTVNGFKLLEMEKQ